MRNVARSVPTANALQTSASGVITSATIVMDGFTGRVVRVRVAKKAGRIHLRRTQPNTRLADKLQEELLSDGTSTKEQPDDEEEEGGGLWKSLSELVLSCSFVNCLHRFSAKRKIMDDQTR